MEDDSALNVIRLKIHFHHRRLTITFSLKLRSSSLRRDNRLGSLARSYMWNPDRKRLFRILILFQSRSESHLTLQILKFNFIRPYIPKRSLRPSGYLSKYFLVLRRYEEWYYIFKAAFGVFICYHLKYGKDVRLEEIHLIF